MYIVCVSVLCVRDGDRDSFFFLGFVIVISCYVWMLLIIDIVRFLLMKWAGLFIRFYF